MVDFMEAMLRKCAELTTPDRIWGFRGDYRWLSNFYPVRVKGQRSVEHAYVAAKSTDPDFPLLIAATSSAGHAKRLGRKTKIRPDWHQVKEEVMLELLRLKFQDPHFAKLLLDTGNREIVEGNLWHDNFWGDCACERCKRTPGQNKLGKMLMRIRRELKTK
jgi:ribA/ribD-fused uncharacterized protein